MAGRKDRVKSRLLTNYYPPKRPRKPIIIVDIETRAIGTGNADASDFKIGAYARENDEDVTFFHSIDEWMNAITAHRNRGYVWYAHNGGEFDYKFLIEAFKDWCASHDGAQVRAVTQGKSGRVIGFVLQHGKHRMEMRDSFALVSASLKKFAQQFSGDYQKQDFDWEKEEFDPDNPDHLDYLRHDVLALRTALISFMQVIEDHFHVPCAWTIAATAMRAWRASLPEHSGFWRTPRACEEFCRRAYYGGLVFLTGLQTRKDAAAIDVNSMYPFVMRKFGVPTGTASYTDHEMPHLPGFYRVYVKASESLSFACIPYRDYDGALLWPTGEFETYLSSVDIDLGRSMGYEITVAEGYVFDAVEHIFSLFVTRCENLRLHYKGTAIEAAAKILQNGLYGKFGTNPNGQTYLLADDDVEDAEPAIDDRTGQIIPGLYIQREELDAPYIMPHWAAWITAQARKHLVSIVSQIGVDAVYYGDTDSVTADAAAIRRAGLPVGLKYGMVKVEHEYSSFTARGPKMYMGVEKETGVIAVKSKGIPRRVAIPEHMQAAFEGEEMPFWFDSTNSTISVLKNGAEFWTRRHRTISKIENSRSWRVSSEAGDVRPVHLNRLVS